MSSTAPAGLQRGSRRTRAWPVHRAVRRVRDVNCQIRRADTAGMTRRASLLGLIEQCQDHGTAVGRRRSPHRGRYLAKFLRLLPMSRPEQAPAAPPLREAPDVPAAHRGPSLTSRCSVAVAAAAGADASHGRCQIGVRLSRVAAGAPRRWRQPGRSAPCADCAAMLGPRSRRETHCATCGRSVQTAAAGQGFKRAARADLGPALLAAPDGATAGARLPRRAPAAAVRARRTPPPARALATTASRTFSPRRERAPAPQPAS